MVGVLVADLTGGVGGGPLFENGFGDGHQFLCESFASHHGKDHRVCG